MIRKILFRFGLLTFLLLLGLGAVAWFYPEKFLLIDSGPCSADCLIVLGGGANERPLRAAQLFHEHAAPKVIVTGAGDDQMNRQLLLRNGVPNRDILVEGKSLTTRENAEFSLRLMRAEGFHSAILVTSWYHSRRSLRVFQHFAPDLTFYARPSYFAYATQDWTRQGINKRMRLEFLKLPGYWVRYGVNPF